MYYVLPIVAALLVGFLAGLLTFKVKTQWCPKCGAVKSCPACAGWTRYTGTSTQIGPNAGRWGR